MALEYNLWQIKEVSRAEGENLEKGRNGGFARLNTKFLYHMLLGA